MVHPNSSTSSIRRLCRNSGQWEGSEARVPEWGTVAGSPDRRAAAAAIHSQIQPEGEKLWKGETEQETGASYDPNGGREAPAAKPLGFVARLSVSRGEESGPWPARAGIPRGSDGDPGKLRKAAEFYPRLVI